MLTRYVIRNQVVANAVHRIARLFNQDGNISYFVNGLIFKTDFNTHQLVHVRKAAILEDNQVEEFLRQPRIFVGLALSPDIIEHITSLSSENLDALRRDLLVEAIDLGMDLNYLAEFNRACQRVLSTPKKWTNIPDIHRPFTTRII